MGKLPFSLTSAILYQTDLRNIAQVSIFEGLVRLAKKKTKGDSDHQTAND
jgi:hypothetical protein